MITRTLRGLGNGAIASCLLPGPGRLLAIRSDERTDVTVLDDAGRPIGGFDHAHGRVFDIEYETRVFVVFQNAITLEYE